MISEWKPYEKKNLKGEDTRIKEPVTDKYFWWWQPRLWWWPDISFFNFTWIFPPFS